MNRTRIKYVVWPEYKYCYIEEIDLWIPFNIAGSLGRHDIIKYSKKKALNIAFKLLGFSDYVGLYRIKENKRKGLERISKFTVFSYQKKALYISDKKIFKRNYGVKRKGRRK